jgi:hypothetical protein
VERMSVGDAGRNFEELIDHVANDRASVALERNHQVVALVTPVPKRLDAKDLSDFFKGLPSLGDDAHGFWDDVERGRRDVPPEADPWA